MGILILFLLPALSFAHRVSVFAYQEGVQIFVEGFFSDGTPTKHATVEVFNREGKKLFSGKTNEKGTLSFKAPHVDAVKIVLNASMGHRAEILFHLTGATTSKTSSTKLASESSKKVPIYTPASGITKACLRTIIRQEVSKAIQPVMRALAKQEAKRISFADIIGGTGWIMGLMGIWMMMKARGKR